MRSILKLMAESPDRKTSEVFRGMIRSPAFGGHGKARGPSAAPLPLYRPCNSGEMAFRIPARCRYMMEAVPPARKEKRHEAIPGGCDRRGPRPGGRVREDAHQQGARLRGLRHDHLPREHARE